MRHALTLVLALILGGAICEAEPRLELECSLWNIKLTAPVTEFRIYEEYLPDYSNKVAFIQLGKDTNIVTNPLIQIERTAEGPTVSYRNAANWVSLRNRGGSAGRWDGGIRFSNGGRYYDGRDTYFETLCTSK